jgi:ribosomal-protein-alanine N-acetyltransferase
VRIETERLVLRPLKATDADAVLVYMSDAEVCRYTVSGPWGPEEARHFAATVHDPEAFHYEFAVVERATGEVVGHAGCEPYGSDASELGWILRRDRWGRGYATEAARVVAAIAASLPGVAHVVARCHPDNAASARVMEKIGLAYDCVCHGDAVKNGVPRDSLRYAAPAAELAASLAGG